MIDQSRSPLERDASFKFDALVTASWLLVLLELFPGSYDIVLCPQLYTFIRETLYKIK